MSNQDESEAEDPLFVQARLFEDEGDRSRHVNMLKALATEIDEPLENIAEVYEIILKGYKENAVIQEFLPVLVSKKIKQAFKTPQL